MSVDAGSVRAGVYFDTAAIASLSKGKIQYSDLYAMLKKIDPEPKHHKVKQPVHIRVLFDYLSTQESQDAVIEVIRKISSCII